jgi:hypothetical protein
MHKPVIKKAKESDAKKETTKYIIDYDNDFVVSPILLPSY